MRKCNDVFSIICEYWSYYNQSTDYQLVFTLYIELNKCTVYKHNHAF